MEINWQLPIQDGANIKRSLSDSITTIHRSPTRLSLSNVTDVNTLEQKLRFVVKVTFCITLIYNLDFLKGGVTDVGYGC